MKRRINWVRVFLTGWAAFALSIVGDDVIKAIKNEPTVFTNIPLNVFLIIVLQATGQAAVALQAQMTSGFLDDRPVSESQREPTAQHKRLDDPEPPTNPQPPGDSHPPSGSQPTPVPSG